MKRVTVIVLTYNQEHSVGRTLESILAQQVSFDYEILIGDDASTDSTRDICERYAAENPGRIRLMPEAPNKGVTNNYFDCLEAAIGEYTADCAGDDRWCSPTKLQRQVELLDAHPDVALVHTAWRPVNASNMQPGADVVQQLKPITPGRTMLMKLLRHDQPQPIHLCSATYRRNMLMQFYEPMKEWFRGQCAEDLPIMALLSAHHPIAYMSDVTLEYTVGGDTISNSAKTERAARFYTHSLSLTAELAQMTGVPMHCIAPSLRRLHAYALALAIASGSHDAITDVESTRRAIGLRPTWKSWLKYQRAGRKMRRPMVEVWRRR